MICGCREKFKDLDKYARLLFASIDVERKGTVSAEQLLGPRPDAVTHKELHRLVEFADLNRKRLLSEGEFVWFYKMMLRCVAARAAERSSRNCDLQR